MISQPGKQTIAIHMLPYIPRNKDNQTIKFGQLIEYNMRNIFLEKSYTKCGAETSSKTFFYKIRIEHTSGPVVSSFTQLIFIVWQVEGYRNISKLSSRPLALTSYKAFFKNKGSGTSFSASFWAWFMKKNISVIFYY